MNTKVKDIKSVLTEGSKAINKKSNYPILGFVCLCAWTNGHIGAFSTNLEKTADCIREIAQDIKEDWQACVPSALIDWLKTCDPKSTVKFELDKRTQVLTAWNDQSTANFKCIDAAEFPEFYTAAGRS